MYIDGIPAFLVKKVGRPNIQFNDVTLEHINIKRKTIMDVNTPFIIYLIISS